MGVAISARAYCYSNKDSKIEYGRILNGSCIGKYYSHDIKCVIKCLNIILFMRRHAHTHTEEDDQKG